MTLEDPDLPCRDVVEMVTDYLEGALPTENAERIEQHLLICDACLTYVDQHRTVIHTLSRLPHTKHAEHTDTSAARSSALEIFRRMRMADEPETGGQ